AAADQQDHEAAGEPGQQRPEAVRGVAVLGDRVPGRRRRGGGPGVGPRGDGGRRRERQDVRQGELLREGDRGGGGRRSRRLLGCAAVAGILDAGRAVLGRVGRRLIRRGGRGWRRPGDVGTGVRGRD